MKLVCLSLFFCLLSGVATAGTVSGRVTVSGEPDGNAVVYLEGDFKGLFPPPLKNPEILQKDQFFYPTALPVLKGTIVDFPNDDDVFHNAFSFSPSNPFDFGPYGPGRAQRVMMAEVGLVEVLCDIHEHMYAYILVLDHPYFGIVEEDRYRILDVPEGTYRIHVFLNPDVSLVKTVEVKAGSNIEVDFALDALTVKNKNIQQVGMLRK